jgi:hypothetical protein
VKLEETWQQLEQDAVGYRGAGEVTRRIFPKSQYDFFLGLEMPSKTKLFIFEPGIPIEHSQINIVASQGFEVQIREKDAVCLRIAKNSFTEIFTTLVEDLIQHLLEVEANKEEAVSKFLHRLNTWQLFMLRCSPEGLSEERQKGLYGELYFMNQVLLPASVQAWRGPTAAAHDFQGRGYAAEVKAVSSKQHQRLTIHSERQLDDAAVGNLYVYHLSLDVNQSRGQTLNQLIEIIRIKAELTGERLLFDELLHKSGYLDAHANLYQTTFYTIRQESVYMVQEGFPRIVEKDLPPGVGDVQYTILADACRRFEVSIGTVKNAVKGNGNVD